MVANTTPLVPIKIPCVHVVLSHFIVMFCTICFFEDETFEYTGTLRSSILFILFAGELLRWGICKYAFGLDGSHKDYTIAGGGNGGSGGGIGRPSSTQKHTAMATQVLNAGKLTVFLMIFVALMCVGCALMGAPYHNQYEETLALSLLLTTLTIMPIALFLGATKTVQYLVYETFELNGTSDCWQLKALQYHGCGALVGAWIGSVVIPLDWDRPWQAYPIPNIVGAVVGFTFANIYTFLASIVQAGERAIDMSSIGSNKKTM